MIWTKDSAKQFLLEIADTLLPDVKSATEFILTELDESEKSSDTEPRVEIIDENHQRFNGEIYSKRKTGYYYLTKVLHTEFYKFFNEKKTIPEGHVIHNIDGKDENNIENLQLMTKRDHTKLHSPDLGKIATFICINCGKEYQSRFQGKNCYCSKKCKEEWRTKEKRKDENRIIKNCEWCGKEFSDWKYGHRRFCSSSCAKFHQWAKMKSEGKYSTGKLRSLTNEQVKYIREVYKPRDEKFSASALAKFFGVGENVIGRIVRGESYTDVK